MAALMLMPLAASAQDDMYFTSSTKVKKQKKGSAYQAPAAVKADSVEYRTYDNDDVIYNGDGIEDESDDVAVNDTLYIDPYETFSDGDGEWVGGFNGSVNDYLHTKRVLQWSNMSSAIPVGSSLYWNLVYGPYSYDWNIFRVGGLAYVTPTWSNPMYTSFSYDLAWGMHNWMNPWRHGWYGSSWYSPWYSPWYGSYWGSYYDFWDPWNYGFGFGWNRGWYSGFYGGYHGWGFPYSHWYYSGRPSISRDRAIGHLSGVDGTRLGSTSRSVLRERSQQHRITDNRSQQRTTRVSGHSVRQTTGNESSSVRSSARNMGREINGGTRSATTTTRQASAEARQNRAQTTRSNSTYTRGADGRNRSAYTRPSSTRSVEAGRSSVGAGRTTTTRSSSIRSMSESRNSGSSNISTRSINSGRSSNSSSMSSGRSGGFSSGGGYSGGGFSGGGSRGGGMSSGGGGSRGGGGGRR